MMVPLSQDKCRDSGKLDGRGQAEFVYAAGDIIKNLTGLTQPIF
jgi:hypothetical protein